MIQGQKIGEVINTILEQRDSKRDYVADTRRVEFQSSGHLLLDIGPTKVSLVPTPVCLTQIGSRLGIPKTYFDQMRAEAPELLARNINHWLHNKPEKRLVRCYRSDSLASGNVARAFLSDKYRPLDNVDIAANILPRLQELGCEVKSAAVTDSRLYIQATCPTLRTEVKKVGDVVEAGIVISNSEVGLGRLNIEHLVYTLRCTNGLISGNVVRKNHVGRRNTELGGDDIQEFFSDETRTADDRAFWLKAKDLVKHALSPEIFQATVAKLDKAASVEIEDPQKALEAVVERHQLSEAESAAILNNFLRGGSPTQYGLLNAVTRAAQDASDYDRAIDLERVGGQILNSFAA